MQQSNLATTPDADEEYRAIETALLETARGRWFLAEHGRRARRLDSALLEDAIDKLKTSLREPPALLGQLKSELESVNTFIGETRQELFEKPTAKADEASKALGAIDGDASPTSDKTGSSILKAAEDMHELAWTLQANDVDPENCEAIALHASKIYALSHQHAVQSEKTLAMAAALDNAGARLVAILDTVMHELEVDQGGAPAELPDLSSPDDAS
ncbi:MAG: hypothetical protein ACRBCJ_01225 [Hyphomicrobiaceae bacterium]